MCSVGLATLAVAVVGTAFSVDSQQKQVKAQNQANQVQHENAMTAYRTNVANIEVTRGQMQADVTNKVNSNNARSREAQSRALAAAGEAGVSGLSVDALLRDLAGEAGMDNTNVEENYLRQDQALNAKRENAFNMTASEINSLRTPVAPNYAAAGLRIADAGLSYYRGEKNRDAIAAGEKPIY